VRTNPDLVRAAIKVDSNIDVTAYIRTATKLVDYIAGRDRVGLLTTELAQELETYLACYFLALKHQQYANKHTGDASAQFQTGQRGKGRFEANDWGLAALAIDVTGELNKLNSGTVTQFGWLGTPVRQQSPWWQRD
jgi:hypothetical protein